MTYSQRAVSNSIHFYQGIRFSLDSLLLSVFGIAFQCKHSPTCSSYALWAVKEHGTIRGLLMGGKRILSCW